MKQLSYFLLILLLVSNLYGMQGQEECAICKDSLASKDRKDVIELACVSEHLHPFHHECLKKWDKQNERKGHRPLCRKTLRDNKSRLFNAMRASDESQECSVDPEPSEHAIEIKEQHSIDESPPDVSPTLSGNPSLTRYLCNEKNCEYYACLGRGCAACICLQGMIWGVFFLTRPNPD